MTRRIGDIGVNVKICQFLGLDPSMVRRLDLHLGLDEAPTVVVESYVREVNERVVTAFKLEPADEVEGDDQ